MSSSNHPPMPPGMPPDPFDDDFMAEVASESGMFEDEDEVFEPLSDQERALLEQDLADLLEFETALAPRGVKGIVIDCVDCQEMHYFDWNILRERMEQMLGDGSIPTHEPAMDPNPDFYVTWDYCLGFLDGLEAPRRVRRGLF
ncbi:MAG TPA: DUF5319 domain-containing protein [Dietzia timorensis]|uniref:DUF5319 domain-containing protein n=1 Tax=Dietzia timorensis TaxID=499555 RepID=A0A921JYJ5_9ACTN|nr:DUF5319 family protein [Dietzia timorensis]HJE91355.1 DUF5319 domain-containing protein [Dietzia timorensis]